MGTAIDNGAAVVPSKRRHSDGDAPITERLTISPPKFRIAEFVIRGTAPLVQHKFSKKAQELMRANMEGGEASKKKKKREPRDFKADYEQARYLHPDGWDGIPAPQIRNAMIDACRMAGFQMTRAKCSVFVLQDGFDAGGTPLIKITKGKPKHTEMFVRNDNGAADIRVRPMWDEGWQAIVRIRFDADQFTVEDVANLLMRAGAQIGIGEGRPFSPNSAGLGWGVFELVGEAQINP